MAPNNSQVFVTDLIHRDEIFVEALGRKKIERVNNEQVNYKVLRNCKKHDWPQTHAEKI